jgi:hypothetical protein
VELSSGASGTTLILSVPLPRAAAARAQPEPQLEANPHDPSGWGEL